MPPSAPLVTALIPIIVPIVVAALIAMAAWRAGSLSRSGAIAATLTGALAMWAGVSWGVFLVAWFASASLASRVGRAAKEARTGDVVAKGGARDAAQVFANGGVFALCALLTLAARTARAAPADPAGGWLPEPMLALMGAAALVAAGADTFATETGTLWRGAPWSLRTGTRVPTGSSGAISVAGTLGMLVAAVLLAAMAWWCGLVPPASVPWVALAGITGAVADTLLGAWWQARRWCPACARETEQDVHRCGTRTQYWRGLPWLDNDAVNLACTVVGAVAMLVLGALTGSRR